MIDRIKRIPELRFSNFYNEWQEKKLGDLGKTYTGLSGKTKTDFGFGDSHFITYMNVFKNNIAKFEMTEKVKISNNEKQNKVNYGDIFFTTSSEVPQEVGMTSIWLFKTNNVYLNSFCFGFRITINNVLPIFLARYLRSENIRKKITILAQGSTRFNLSKKEVMKLSINFPEINEQQKIGDFFSKLDRQIELEEQKLAKLEEQKKGYMQKVFSQELRFKDENGNDYPEWVEETIPQIIQLITDYVANGSFAAIRENVTYSSVEDYAYVIRLQDANANWKGPFVYTNENAYDFLKKTSLFENDIIMSNVGTVGKFFKVPKMDKPMTLGPNALLFRSESNDMNFLYFYLNSKFFKKKLKRIITPGVQSKVNKTDLKKIAIKMPKLKEQEKIGDFFSKLDEHINKQSQKIGVLKQRKKGFLQKMFV